MVANYKKSIPKLLELLKEHGVVDNFLRLYGKKDVERRGYLFTDSDLYKWMEAAAFVLQSEDAPEIKKMLDEVIDDILPAQGEDGYLNTWFVDDRADKRFTDLVSAHELYCAGHLIQAAIAHHRATGETRLLGAAIRFADYLDETFGAGKMQGFAGHPEIELALVELYRETGQNKYLDLAKFFLTQNDIREFQEITGHAVRAGYFACGGTDYYLETGDQDFLKSLHRQWESMANGKMYVTGGVGSRPGGEKYGRMFELPTSSAYTETCAGISTIFWNWRMLAINGEAKYADLMEKTLYNGFLSGVSLSGTEYFYVNPLYSSGKGEDDPWYKWGRKEPIQRKPWYNCTCCPPNIERLLASLPGYFYSISDEGVWVHLYDNSEMNWRLSNGMKLSLEQRTSYPWDGMVEISLSPEKPKEFSLFLRIPSWCQNANGEANGKTISAAIKPGTYLQINRKWKAGDKVRLNFDMPVELVESDPRVLENRGNVAIQRGPIVYCLEGTDNPGFNVIDARVNLDSNKNWETAKAEFEKDTLGGVVVITGNGIVPVNPDDQGPLYRPIRNKKQIEIKDVTLTAISYYAWCNRGPTSMTVWIQRGEKCSKSF